MVMISTLCEYWHDTINDNNNNIQFYILKWILDTCWTIIVDFDKQISCGRKFCGEEEPKCYYRHL